jgi:hypothetical protein
MFLVGGVNVVVLLPDVSVTSLPEFRPYTRDFELSVEPARSEYFDTRRSPGTVVFVVVEVVVVGLVVDVVVVVGVDVVVVVLVVGVVVVVVLVLVDVDVCANAAIEKATRDAPRKAACFFERVMELLL